MSMYVYIYIKKMAIVNKWYLKYVKNMTKLNWYLIQQKVKFCFN